jgi:hypothetical protein
MPPMMRPLLSCLACQDLIGGGETSILGMGMGAGLYCGMGIVLSVACADAPTTVTSITLKSMIAAIFAFFTSFKPKHNDYLYLPTVDGEISSGFLLVFLGIWTTPIVNHIFLANRAASGKIGGHFAVGFFVDGNATLSLTF